MFRQHTGIFCMGIRDPEIAGVLIVGLSQSDPKHRIFHEDFQIGLDNFNPSCWLSVSEACPKCSGSPLFQCGK